MLSKKLGSLLALAILPALAQAPNGPISPTTRGNIPASARIEKTSRNASRPSDR
jgi:hypothetical protein